MSETAVKICIYPGCDRPAVPPHELGGPEPHYCELEEHNAGSTFLARKAAAAEADGAAEEGGEAPA
jgi:hypothetical protein